MRTSATSSAGFKKRLLRPVSQHQSQKQFNNELLKHIDLSLAQSTLDNISTNNLDLFSKYIQSLDIDKSIRKKKAGLTQSAFSFNDYSGITYLKEWITKENDVNLKLTQNKENQDIDIPKILSKIRCQSVESGFKKIYKCLKYFDKVVTKSCQSLIIQILKYHETYVTQIQQDDKESYRLFLEDLTLSSMDNGLFLVKLLPIFMSRQGKIFSQLIKTTKQKKTSFNNSQMYQQKQQTYRQTCLKLEKLIKQNCELKERQDKIDVELQKIRVQKALIQEMKSKSPYSMIDKYQKEMKELYAQQIKEITKEMDAQMSSNIALRTKIKELQFQNKKYAQQKGKNPLPKFKGTQFNEAMMEQFNKMRKGFEKKIQEMKQSSVQGQKQLRKELNKLRKNLQNVEWQKRVVLKKYQFLATC